MSRLVDAHQTLLVAEERGEIVGVVNVFVGEQPTPTPAVVTATIAGLEVAAHRRGAGVGPRLLTAAQAWARERGASELWLDLAGFNPRGIGEREEAQAISRRLRIPLET
jgi:GNAT superfamily N-acetyltransferase